MQKHCPIYESRLDSGHEQRSAFLLLNETVFSHLDQATAALLALDAASTTCTHYANAFDFCEATGVANSALALTMVAYSASEEGCHDSFGKKCFPVRDFSFSHPLCVVRVTPVLSHSLGGLQVSQMSKDDIFFISLY
jgi:hypothetical protein